MPKPTRQWLCQSIFKDADYELYTKNSNMATVPELSRLCVQRVFLRVSAPGKPRPLFPYIRRGSILDSSVIQPRCPSESSPSSA